MRSHRNRSFCMTTTAGQYGRSKLLLYGLLLIISSSTLHAFIAPQPQLPTNPAASFFWTAQKRSTLPHAASRSFLLGVDKPFRSSKNIKMSAEGKEERSAKNQKTESIGDVLHRLSRDVSDRLGDPSQIYHAATKLVDKGLEEKNGSCYFLTDGDIKFRHEGDDLKAPPKFFLIDRNTKRISDKVLVMFSASGSGKSVELAGSSVSRGADLTIMVTMKDTTINNVKDKKEREKGSWTLLASKMSNVSNDAPVLREVLQLGRADRPLRLVVAIDEASTCTRLVQSIIVARRQAEKTVIGALGARSGCTTVLFSVGGTGAASGSIGSNTKNFEVVQPAARGLAERICNDFLQDVRAVFPGENSSSEVSYKTVNEKLPVLGTLLNNGRMASIAAEIIKTPTSGAINENEIVAATVDAYRASNGLNDLKNPRVAEKVAACAFAVHLFQWDGKNGNSGTFPTGDEEFQEFVDSMQCGVEFSGCVEAKVGRGPFSAVHMIVRKYGLLEPKTDEEVVVEGGPAENRFVMTSVQQLVAMTMLGMKPSSFLAATPFGFECLSVHMAKCALAAAMMIDPDSRPRLKEVLVKAGLQNDSCATSSTVEGKWDALADFSIEELWYDFSSLARPEDRENSRQEAAQTSQMDVELALLVDTNGGKDLLQISTAALRILKKLRPVPENVEQNPRIEERAALPSTWVNNGASPLADGFITFFCRNCKNDGAPPFKFTLMIQSKDYHNESRINVKKVNEHAQRCSDPSLNAVFGNERLLCVAGNTDVVLAKRDTDVKRDFIPYVCNLGNILTGLLGVLEERRNVNTRISTLATIVDTAGKEWNPPSDED